ncbi:hypothetical protein Tco_0298579 [Tanacetum coccineum]
MISPAFVEANYEILESLLRERRKHIRNKDLQKPPRFSTSPYKVSEGSKIEREGGRLRRCPKSGWGQAAHLRRSENGQPMQSSLTFIHGGPQPSINTAQRVFRFVHGLRTRSLVEFLSTNLPTTYKGLMEKTYTWIEAREVATNGAQSNRSEGFDMSKKNPSWDNNKG